MDQRLELMAIQICDRLPKPLFRVEIWGLWKWIVNLLGPAEFLESQQDGLLTFGGLPKLFHDLAANPEFAMNKLRLKRQGGRLALVREPVAAEPALGCKLEASVGQHVKGTGGHGDFLSLPEFVFVIADNFDGVFHKPTKDQVAQVVGGTPGGAQFLKSHGKIPRIGVQGTGI
jgi:hypothetical protein